METYSVSGKKYTTNKNSSVRKKKLSYQIALFVAKKLYKHKELHKFDWFKMNKNINQFLLTGDKFMPELHLKQPGFTYSACGSLTKHRKIIQKYRKNR